MVVEIQLLSNNFFFHIAKVYGFEFEDEKHEDQEASRGLCVVPLSGL
jgi:hypothetical protein